MRKQPRGPVPVVSGEDSPAGLVTLHQPQKRSSCGWDDVSTFVQVRGAPGQERVSVTGQGQEPAHGGGAEKGDCVSTFVNPAHV